MNSSFKNIYTSSIGGIFYFSRYNYLIVDFLSVKNVTSLIGSIIYIDYEYNNATFNSSSFFNLKAYGEAIFCERLNIMKLLNCNFSGFN